MFAKLNRLWMVLQQYDWLVGTQFKSLELAKSDWAIIRKSPAWALDSWGLGEFTTLLFSSGSRGIPGWSYLGQYCGQFSSCWTGIFSHILYLGIISVIIGSFHQQDASYTNFFPLPSLWRRRICGTRLKFLRWWLWTVWSVMLDQSYFVYSTILLMLMTAGGKWQMEVLVLCFAGFASKLSEALGFCSFKKIKLC